MITNFEDITYELTIEEQSTISTIVKSLKEANEPLNNQKLQIIIFDKLGLNINGARLRKIINCIRTKNVLNNLLANSKGYYISENKIEIEKYVQSLQDRIDAINQVKNSYKI